MGEQILTIDLGNSRAKLVAFEVGPSGLPSVVAEAAFENGPALAREIDAWLERRRGLRRALLSSVAALALEDQVADALSARFGAAFWRNPPVRMAIDYEPAHTLGRDRLYAARGAVHGVARDAIVVDAGTALTVDAVVGGTAPRFCGGAIAPGPRLMAEALHRHTARLPLVEPRVGAHALGTDTLAALQAGVVVGFRGAAAELARRVAEEAKLGPAASVVVTGGARALLLKPRSCFADLDVVENAHLVHLGLWAALADSP